MSSVPNRFQSIPWALAALGTCFSTVGCRSKIDVQVKSGAPLPIESKPSTDPSNPPAGTVTPTTGVQQDPDKALLPVKVEYQSRDVLRLRLSNSLLGAASSLSVLNVTGLAFEAESDAPALLRDVEIPVALALTESTGMKSFDLIDLPGVTFTRDAEGLVVSITPSAYEIRKLVKYGLNKLKIIANDPIEPRYTYATLTVKDFDVFGPAMVGFEGPNAPQTAVLDGPNGYQFQGWLNVVSPPVVTLSTENGGSSLTHGVFNIVN
jgi:hypothetical protein